MSIKISADSTCDLSPELIEEYGIGIMPLGIVKGGHTYRDGLEITPRDVFEYFESEGAICQTTAVNIEEYASYFKEQLKSCDSILHFTISSEMSACYQNACIASADMDGVFVVDSRNLSTGIGNLVLDAVFMAREGVPAPEIFARIEAEKQKLDVSFVLNTLKFLHKGGRCSGVAALGANLLQLKPCIEVKSGKMDVGKKYRGTFEKCILQYVEDRLKNTDSIDARRIFITSTGDMDEHICRAVREKTLSLIPFETVYETKAGCTISNHCGPNCLGLLFFRK